jgi:integrase
MTTQRKRRGWAEGSVYQRADGRWVGSVSLGYDGAGKRKRRVVYAATKGEVQAELRKLQTSADAGTLGDASRVTVGEYLTRWLENTARPRIGPVTYARYEQLVRLHVRPLLGGLPLAKLRAAHVEQFYADLERKGESPIARRQAGRLLTAALRHAVVGLKQIPHNPAADIPKPRAESREMHFLTEPQVRQFLDAARGKRLYALFALAIGSGMRQGEMLALRWSDIDFDAGTVAVRRSLSVVKGEFVEKEPKSKAGRRTISVSPWVVDALRDHRAKMLAEGNIAAPVFCTRVGTFIEKTNLVRRFFRPVLDKANELAAEKAGGGVPALLPPIRFHDLRHTHATLLLSQGQSIKAVSYRLGHAKADVTLRVYAHVLPTDDAKLAEGLNRLYG